MGRVKKSLVIVESPAKARTINKILGAQFEVKASMGHVRDLPDRELGVDIEAGFEPRYVPVRGRRAVLEELRKAAAAADAVYLAPDPDREGEAIAWHLREALNGARQFRDKTFHRVTFNEITKDAVRRAFAEPRDIDMAKVDSQQARRILDRLVGYKLSPLLWRKVGKGLSAGRVQSVAVRLVCEREEEIRRFVAEEFWTIDAELRKQVAPRDSFRARLFRVDGEKAAVGDATRSGALCRDLERAAWHVSKIQDRERQRRPAAPFTTSTLQQAAGSRLRMTTRQTMMLAQQLYEGIDIDGGGPVGLITYMRTDSVNVAQEAQDGCRAFIAERYGDEYVPARPNFYRSRAGAQGAHEAIRPTAVALLPEEGLLHRGLNPRQLALYRLIWERFVASQMAPARLQTRTVEVVAAPAAPDAGAAARTYEFRATSTRVLFDGFQRVMPPAREGDKKRAATGETGAAAAEGEAEGERRDRGADEDTPPETVLPPLQEGEPLDLAALDPQQHFTQPPPRYAEATLVRALEENGVGRPSTYAPTISTVLQRKYVERESRLLRPTQLGETVNRLLVEHFPDLVNVEFTSQMESQLDQIEEGQVERHQLLTHFYADFEKTLTQAAKHMDEVKRQTAPTDIACDKCGRPMVIRWSKNGEFLSCSGFPKCKNAKSFVRGNDGRVELVEQEHTDHICEECGKPMIIRTGRYGRFLACSGYPECRSTRPIPTNIPCPRPGCDGTLIERMNRRRRRFYGCSNYPKCDYVINDLEKVGKEQPAGHRELADD